MARLPAPDNVLARVFGLFESLITLAVGVGALVASLLIEWTSISVALVIVGALCPSLVRALSKPCIGGVATPEAPRPLYRRVGLRNRAASQRAHVPAIAAASHQAVGARFRTDPCVRGPARFSPG
jgi:hypothetical protein